MKTHHTFSVNMVQSTLTKSWVRRLLGGAACCEETAVEIDNLTGGLTLMFRELACPRETVDSLG